MMNPLKTVNGLLCFSAAVFSACSPSSDEFITLTTTDCGTVTYLKNIKPLIESECGGSACHGAGSKEGDYSFYEGAKIAARSGEMRREVLDDRSMPEDKRLTEEQLAAFECWLNAGAPRN